MLGLRTAVVAALIGAVPFAPVPAASPSVAADGAPFSDSIWLPYWLPGAVADVTANADVLHTASLFWWDAASCSSIRREPGAGGRADVNRLRAHGLEVMATVVGSGLPPRAAIRCFSHRHSRRVQVRRLVALADRGHYAGVDIDYETLAHTKKPSVALQVRSAFTEFVADLCHSLRSHSMKCDITVMPRVDDSTRVWLGRVTPGVYDYASIAAAADRMRVMAYDQHSHQFGPGPVAGYPWVKRVITYAAGKTSLVKVELGIPLYGRDFAGHDSVAVTSNAALALARRHGVRPRFDPVQREMTFQYRRNGVRHTVWFSNAKAVAARTRLAAASGMAGAAYWAATYELPSTWKAVRRTAR
ncbi:MAG TPA: glycosyl hydrolase family 18 protein [Mycobacteriales bacterium]|nr:glycosyl hydrolase family 18 protein [Mycobacteriales bacterium]